MKKNLLIILIFLTLSSKGQTYIYHPFPDSSAIWNFNYLVYGMICGDFNDNYSITLSGDTIVSSQTYHKLSTPFVQSFPTGTCGTWTSIGYKGAVRQDIANKKVYYLPPTNSTEQLLYDFNMQIGDTVKGYIETYAFTTDTVQSIDSVLVGSSYRKRWNINSCYNIHLIEGIGSTYGLIAFSPGCPTDSPDYSITCFQQSGQPLYPSTSTYCELITAVNSIDKISNEVKIFPNPSNGSFTIDLDKAVIKEIKLYDLLGNIIFSKQTNNQIKFNIDNLQNGIYILTLIDKDDRKINSKIIRSP